MPPNLDTRRDSSVATSGTGSDMASHQIGSSSATTLGSPEISGTEKIHVMKRPFKRDSQGRISDQQWLGKLRTGSGSTVSHAYCSRKLISTHGIFFLDDKSIDCLPNTIVAFI